MFVPCRITTRPRASVIQRPAWATGSAGAAWADAGIAQPARAAQRTSAHLAFVNCCRTDRFSSLIIAPAQTCSGGTVRRSPADPSSHRDLPDQRQLARGAAHADLHAAGSNAPTVR